jgi:methylmalonyl-CoA mutase N-terminal domain/subunit
LSSHSQCVNRICPAMTIAKLRPKRRLWISAMCKLVHRT